MQLHHHISLQAQLTIARKMESPVPLLIASGSRNRKTMNVISIAIASSAMKMIQPEAPRTLSTTVPLAPRSLTVPTATAALISAANAKAWVE